MHDPLLRAGMELHRIRYWQPLERMATSRMSRNSGCCGSPLCNRQTRFGVEHRFDRDYRRLRNAISTGQDYGAPITTSGARVFSADRGSPVFYARRAGPQGAALFDKHWAGDAPGRTGALLMPQFPLPAGVRRKPWASWGRGPGPSTPATRSGRCRAPLSVAPPFRAVRFVVPGGHGHRGTI